MDKALEFLRRDRVEPVSALDVRVYRVDDDGDIWTVTIGDDFGPRCDCRSTEGVCEHQLAASLFESRRTADRRPYVIPRIPRSGSQREVGEFVRFEIHDDDGETD